MKQFYRVALFVVLAAAPFTSIFAQREETKDEQFGKIAELSQSENPEDLEKTYLLGKKFLNEFGWNEDETVEKVRNFVEKYRLSAFDARLAELRIAEA
jgi:hypothetical protein